MSHTQQPTAHPGMTAGGNRNAKNIPVGPDGRDWSNGLFGCFGDFGTCLVACCCPCITYGKVKHRYEHLNSKGFPDPEHGGGCCSSDCMIHGILMSCGFGFILQMGTRANIRGRYNVKGGAAGDCCSTFCCTPCALVQESQELELEESSFGKSG